MYGIVWLPGVHLGYVEVPPSPHTPLFNTRKCWFRRPGTGRREGEEGGVSCPFCPFLLHFWQVLSRSGLLRALGLSGLSTRFTVGFSAFTPRDAGISPVSLEESLSPLWAQGSTRLSRKWQKGEIRRCRNVRKERKQRVQKGAKPR